MEWYRSEYAPRFLADRDGYASDTDADAEPTEELKRTGRRPSFGDGDDAAAMAERRLPAHLPRALPATATQMLEFLHLEVGSAAQGDVHGACGGL